MKAAVLYGNEDIRYDDYPTPQTKPGTVKIRVRASGICGSDIPRVLHEGQGLEIHEGGWEILPVFRMLEKWGGIPHREMFNIFNMGIGMVLVLDESEAGAAIRILESRGEKASVIGKVTAEPGVNIIMQ